MRVLSSQGTGLTDPAIKCHVKIIRYGVGNEPIPLPVKIADTEPTVGRPVSIIFTDVVIAVYVQWDIHRYGQRILGNDSTTAMSGQSLIAVEIIF